MKKQAEGDLAALWRLYDWCDAYGMTTDSRSVLRAILRVDENDRKARELLGHVLHEGRWFASEAQVEQHRRKQLEAEARRTGMAIHEGRLVDPADLPFLEKGMVRGPDGSWLDPEQQRKLEQGWVLQDLEWIPPEEVPQIEKGLWKCGDVWLSEAEADVHHAELASAWRIPGQHFVLHTTLPRALAWTAMREAERAHGEVVRALGRGPDARVPLLVLRSEEQLRRVAEGEGGQRNELRGIAFCHGAYLAEVGRAPLVEDIAPVGVAHWDATTPAGNSFGPTFVRHAAAQSVLEALDPTPKVAIGAKRDASQAAEAFWNAKRLPEWLRLGIAVHAERYLLDGWAGAHGDPLWIRKWSVSNIGNKGGLEPLERVFAFELDPRDCSRTIKLLNQAGLMVAFLLDGDVPQVQAAHAALVQAFTSGGDVDAASRALEQVLVEHQDALRTFSGL